MTVPEEAVQALREDVLPSNARRNWNTTIVVVVVQLDRELCAPVLVFILQDNRVRVPVCKQKGFSDSSRVKTPWVLVLLLRIR